MTPVIMLLIRLRAVPCRARCCPLFGGAGDDDLAVFILDADPFRKLETELSLGSLDGDGGAVELHFHLVGKRDWFDADS